VVSRCGVGPPKQAQPQVPYHAPRVAALHRRSQRARCGVALVGNPEEVDAVASSNRSVDRGRKPKFTERADW